VNALHYQNDCERFIQDCLYIKDKDARLVPFFSSGEFPAQRHFIRLVEEERRAGRPVRIVALKARQVGLTSVSSAVVYHATAMFHNVETRIASDDLESAEAIHEKNDIFWERSPLELRPMRARSSVREMAFANPKRRQRPGNPGLRSRILVNTAKKITLGRSHTIRNFVGSEVAYWADGEATALSVMQAVPERPGTIIILESTANGAVGYFYDMCEEAQKVGSSWRFFFFPWFMQPEYTRAVDEQWNAENLNEEEEELVGLFGLTPGQIAWRRHTLVNKCQNDPDLLHQEYPSTPKEAFRSSGRPAFNRVHLDMQEQHLQQGRKIRLRIVGENQLGPVAHAELDSRANLTVFEPPQYGRVYIVGIDPAKGLEENDFQCAQVVDVLTSRQVAVLHMLVPPGEFADECYALGAWYNVAQLVPEKNGEGINILVRLVQRNYPRVFAEAEYDQDSQRVSQKRGWHMDEQKKHLIISELKNGLNPLTGRLRIRDPDTLQEMKDMVRDKLGRYNAPKGKHDDRVSALALAYFVAHSEAVILEQAERTDIIDPVYQREPLSRRQRRYQKERAELVNYWES
jgi:hypothetical protein